MMRLTEKRGFVERRGGVGEKGPMVLEEDMLDIKPSVAENAQTI